MIRYLTVQNAQKALLCVLLLLLRNQGADDFSHLPSQFTPDTTKGAAHKSRPPSCSTKLTTALAKFNAIKAPKYTDLNPAKVGNKYVSTS